jgi:hypothetical protein
MNHKKIYEAIINRAHQRTLIGYFEKHHIIPKCLGGSNKKENLAKLTAREHFIVHVLLCQIYTENTKLLYAFHAMLYLKDSNQERNFRIKSKQYQYLKEKLSKYLSSKPAWNRGIDHLSQQAKANIGKSNRVRSLGKPLSDCHKAAISRANKGKPHNISLSNRKIISDNMKRKWKENPLSHIKNQSGSQNHFFGKRHSTETLKKMSEARRNYWQNKERPG